MVFRASSQTIRPWSKPKPCHKLKPRDLLLGKKDKPTAAKRSSTPRRDARPRPASGFRVIVPVGSVPGQVIRVQAPDGQQVDVTVPEGAFAGQPMWVQLPEAEAADARQISF